MQRQGDLMMAFTHQSVRETVEHDLRSQDNRERESTANHSENEELKSFAQDTTLFVRQQFFQKTVMGRGNCCLLRLLWI